MSKNCSIPMRSVGIFILLCLLASVLVVPALAATEHCPDHNSDDVEKVNSTTGGDLNDVVLDTDTAFCVKASNQATGQTTADGSTSLIEYVEQAGIVKKQDKPHDVSYYVVYQEDNPLESEPSVTVTHDHECGTASITLTNNDDVPADWNYGITVEVDGVVEDDNLVVGPGIDTITVSLVEDQSDGNVDVEYYITDATEWDIVPSDLNYQSNYPTVTKSRAFSVDTDCERPVQPDEEVAVIHEPGEWIDGEFECGDTTVVQTPVVTHITTITPFVFDETSGEWILDTDNRQVMTEETTEERTRELSEDETFECPISCEDDGTCDHTETPTEEPIEEETIEPAPEPASDDEETLEPVLTTLPRTGPGDWIPMLVAGLLSLLSGVLILRKTARITS